MTSCFDLAPLPALKDATILCVNSSKNVKLRAALFTPLTQGNKGTICLFSGRTEFIEKYAEVISDLRQRGFMVAALDWRGQGGSSRVNTNSLKGHVENFDDYCDDLNAFMEQVVSKSCPKPHIALSHSMGGLILLKSAFEGKNHFDKYVFSSPFIDLASGGANTVAKILIPFLETIGLSQMALGALKPSFEESFENNKITKDKARFDKMNEASKTHSQLYIGAPTVHWLYEAMNAQKKINTPPASLPPMLFVVAMSDRIVSAQATLNLAANIKSAKLQKIEGSEHEVLFESDALRNQFWKAFDTFIS